MIPDYFALLKARIVITVIKHTRVTIFSLFMTLFIDFLVGIWVFLTSFASLQVIALILYAGSFGTMPPSGDIYSFLMAGFFIGGLLFTIEFLLIVGSGLLFVNVPIGNIFWASMLPSMWLWAYIISALLTRLLLSSKSLLRWLVYFLDVAEHPIRSLGIVTGAVLAVAFAIALLILTVLSRFQTPEYPKTQTSSLVEIVATHMGRDAFAARCACA